MLLILTYLNEPSTDNVISWLHYYAIPFIRLNTETSLTNVKVQFDTKQLSYDIAYKNKLVNLKEIDSVWFRRGAMSYIYPYVEKKNVTKYVKRHLYQEAKTQTDFFHYLLLQKKHLNDPYNYNFNKLIALQKAREVGFEIPATLITENNSELESFQKMNGNVISKPIQDGVALSFFALRQFLKLPNNNKRKQFATSLFQKEINIKAELRVFYIDQKIFTAAIHTSKERKNFTRTAPYQLPIEIEKKVIAFMQSCNLNSGSLDIILSHDNRFIFLEVNPVGQFDTLSKQCNFYLEREIANYFKS